MEAAADWDSSLRAIERGTRDIIVSTGNVRLKGYPRESIDEFLSALAHERKMAQSTLVMLSNRLDISKKMAGEMKEANLSTVRSALALRSAFQILICRPLEIKLS